MQMTDKSDPLNDIEIMSPPDGEELALPRQRKDNLHRLIRQFVDYDSDPKSDAKPPVSEPFQYTILTSKEHLNQVPSINWVVDGTTCSYNQISTKLLVNVPVDDIVIETKIFMENIRVYGVPHVSILSIVARKPNGRRFNCVTDVTQKEYPWTLEEYGREHQTDSPTIELVDSTPQA